MGRLGERGNDSGLVVRRVPGVHHSRPSRPLSAHDGCVDRNAAKAAELRRIMHIDEEHAEMIIRLRRGHPCRSVAAIMAVQGIGQRRARDIQNQWLACVAR
jgi:DNA uptake protein ComE-like DNA-binding protein